MKTIPVCDIAIVGAGPSGALTAGLLARAGISVNVLEARQRTERKVCGEYLCPAGSKLMRELGLESILSTNFLPIYGMKLVSPGGKIVTTSFPLNGTCELPGFSLNRQIFDEQLVEWAKSMGAKFHFNTRVQKIHFDQGTWTLSLPGGQSLHSTLMIGADGRQSFVAKSLGLLCRQKEKRVALHFFAKARQTNQRQGEMHILSGGSYLGVDPIDQHESNVSLVCDAQLLKKYKTPGMLARKLFQQSSEISQHHELPERNLKVVTAFPITSKVKDVIATNAALIGDAAGFIDPLTGEGIYHGLWTAQALANELIPSWQKDQRHFTLALANYKRARIKQFQSKQRVSIAFQWIIRRRWLCELIGSYLGRSTERGNVFIGIIGNLISPWAGFKKILFTSA